MYRLEQSGVLPHLSRCRELGEVVGENIDLFEDCLAYRDELGRRDKTGIILRCRERAINEFVSINDMEEFIARCELGICTDEDFGNIFFQKVPRVIREEISKYIVDNIEDVNLSQKLLKHLRSIRGANVSHFIFGLY